MIAPHQQFSIEDGNDDFAVGKLHGSVNNQYIPFKDTDLRHGITFHPKEERGRFIADQLFIEVNAPFGIIIGCRPEAGGIGGTYFLLRKGLGAFIGRSEK